MIKCKCIIIILSAHNNCCKLNFWHVSEMNNFHKTKCWYVFLPVLTIFYIFIKCFPQYFSSIIFVSYGFLKKKITLPQSLIKIVLCKSFSITLKRDHVLEKQEISCSLPRVSYDIRIELFNIDKGLAGNWVNSISVLKIKAVHSWLDELGNESFISD